jgi:VIT1/CCC1 family predicted Fe2+/Mn2+ transporter
LGAALPVVVTFLAPIKEMVYYQYGFTIFFLIILGIVTAKTGGSGIMKAVLRVVFWGTAAMVASAFVGYLFGVHVE